MPIFNFPGMFWRLYTELHQLPSRVGMDCSRSMNPSQHPRTAEPARTEQPLVCAAPSLVSARSCSRRSLRCKSCGKSLAQEWNARFSFGVIFCGSISPKRLCGFRPCAPTLCKSAALLKPRPFLLPFAARDCFPQRSWQIFVGVNGSPGPAASLAAAAD